jgi:hypothetical protein
MATITIGHRKSPGMVLEADDVEYACSGVDEGCVILHQGEGAVRTFHPRGWRWYVEEGEGRACITVRLRRGGTVEVAGGADLIIESPNHRQGPEGSLVILNAGRVRAGSKT